MQNEHAYIVYFIKPNEVPEGMHQLDVLPTYFGGVDVGPIKKEWETECKHRCQGFQGADFVCWCFCDLAPQHGKQIGPSDCSECPHRKWRDE